MENKPVALILEPEPMQRDLMALTLQNLNCEVLVTQDAAEARRMLRERKITLLIIDTLLPKVSGLDLLKSYQTAHLLDATRVIVISALGFEGIVRQAAQLGISSYLVKPIDLQVFAAKVKELLALNTRLVGC
jgi:DNA-binding response OmpR family regulator